MFWVAVANLLAAPNLRLLSVESNKLGEAQLVQLASAIRDHPRMAELAVGGQHDNTLLTSKAVEAMLAAMETVPTLVKLRLGALKDEVLRRRYLVLENRHVADLRKAAYEARRA